MQLLSAATASAKLLLRSSSRWQRCHSHTFHRSISTERHHLLDPSPFIRSLAPRPIAPPPPPSQPSPTDFTIYPNFLNHEEQAALITLALWKLDRVDSRKKRRRRRRVGDDPIINQDTRQESLSTHDQLQSLFEADSEYGFEEGHFDSVITNYRESILSTFPPPTLPSISPLYPSILSRIYSLLPSDLTSSQSLRHPPDVIPRANLTTTNPDAVAPFIQPPQTTAHVLHLSSRGCILPHVDNVEASGSIIIGVSLGADRIMRLERDNHQGDKDGWEILLKSGSVYIQQDSIRYQYKHSILPYCDSKWNGEPLVPGHRISLMIRNALPTLA